MKNKDVEEYVFKALDFFEKDRDAKIDETVKKAFAAHRVQDVTEIQIKNLERCLKSKDEEIWEHKKAIENLRGYMGFLESQIEQYKFRLDEHEDSY